MAKYKIQPVNIKTGSVAPYYVEDFENEHEVEKFAKTLSPLFAFVNWEPSISKLSSNPKSKRYGKN